MSRRLLCLSLMLVLVTAGCLGGPTASPSASTATATDEAENGVRTATSTANLSQPESFPLGTTEEGISAASLFTFHLDTLGEAEGYSTRLVMENNATGEDQLRYERVINDSARGALLSLDSREASLESWEPHSTRGKFVLDRQSEEDQRYFSLGTTAVSSHVAVQTRVGDRELVELIDRGNYTFGGVVRRDGDQLLRYVSSEPASQFESGAEGAAYTATVLVQQNGVIRDLSISSTEVDGGEPVRTVVSYETTVEPTAPQESPEWTSGVHEVNVTRVSDGVLRITNTGDQTMNRRSRLEIDGSLATLGEPLSPDSSVYLVSTGEDGLEFRTTEPETGEGTIPPTTFAMNTVDGGAIVSCIPSLPGTTDSCDFGS